MQQLFTQYWEYLAVQNSCKVNLFDQLAQSESVATLCHKYEYKPQPLQFLLSFLLAENYLQLDISNSKPENYYICTPKGLLFTDNNPNSIKNSCILWGEEHLTAWQNLDYTLKNGTAAFDYVYKKPFWEYIAADKQKLANYHRAMGEYARNDYKNIATLIEFNHKVIADIGGGIGILVNNLANKYVSTQFILADLQVVLNLAVNLANNVEKKSVDFFNNFGFNADGLIMARILHDWEDKKAATILKNCADALNDDGNLYILEIMQDEIKADLLSLNMLLICKSYERTFEQYQSLLNHNGFVIKQKIKANDLQTMLICSKKPI